MLGSLKHFPGQGDAGVDTHEGRAVIDRSMAELEARELIPFARLLHEAWWVPRWTNKEGGREGEVFVFGNGSFVSWGLGEDEAGRFAEDVLVSRSAAEIARLKELETEELEFVTDPQE